MSMTNFIGLGPPDLIVLEKAYNPPKLLPGIIKRARHSYFHWTLGNDVSSSAAVATYLGFLLENQEKHTIGRGLFVIDKCYTCSYNAFRKMDLRVEITIPEPAKKHNGYSIEAYAVDAVGNKHELDEAFWKETHVCAMLRLIEGPPPELRPMKIRDSLYDPFAETQFLNMCIELFPQGRRLGNPENAYSLYGVDSSNNLLTSVLCKFFIQHNRYEHMLSFFDNFTSIDPVASVPIAYAEAMLDRSSRALTLLDGSLRRKPDSASIMLSIAELGLLNLPFGLDRHIKLLDTLKTTLNGISLRPNLSRGWWILSKCLIEMGRYEWALVAMNNAPVVCEEYSHRLVDNYGNPHFEKFTSPELVMNHILTVLQDEDKAFKDDFGDTSLRLLAAPDISPDEKTVYSLLSDIISRSSWDHLTKIRSRVLVRPAEMQKAKARFMKGEQEPQELQEPQEPAQALNTAVLRQSVDSSSQKDEGKSYSLDQSSSLSSSSSVQQSTEFSPEQTVSKCNGANQREQGPSEVDSKDGVFERPSDLRTTQEVLAASSGSAGSLQDINISDKSEYSAPTFSIARDLDVDDALTQFFVYVLSARTGSPVGDIPTTPMIRDISRNVDVAFHAIFQDIKAFHAWKEEEKKLNLVGVEDIPAKYIPLRTVADWIRIAAMCERLSFTKDASKIYKMLEHQHIKALGSIVTFDAERGDIKSTLLDASTLLAHYAKYNIQQPPPLVVNAVVKLVSTQGSHKVRSMQSSMPYLHPLVPPIVQDTVRWKSKGFDV